MTHYRYESVDSAGVPIYGTVDVASPAKVAEHLSERGLKLVSCHELSVESLVQASGEYSTRLHNLGIGTYMREAFLTSLPADQALSALSAEPMSHPMIGITAWTQLIALLFLTMVLTLGQVVGLPAVITTTAGVITLVMLPLASVLVIWLYRWRPREAMRSLARILETGQNPEGAASLPFSRELRGVMKSQLTDEQKSRVAADLIPALLGAKMKSQQVLLGVAGPIFLLSVVCIGFHVLMVTAVQQFRTLFDSFGAELPALTVQLFRLSDAMAAGGMTAVFVVAGLIAVLAIGVLMILATRVCDEILEAIPVFGVLFRLQMQSRVARVLAALLRCGCPYPAAVETATAVSGHSRVKDFGISIAGRLKSEQSQPESLPSELAGLPFSMLFVQPSDTSKEQRAISVAQTFHIQAEMLDNAAVGQGRLMAVVLQLFAIGTGGILLGTVMLVIYLPLIKLISNLM